MSSSRCRVSRRFTPAVQAVVPAFKGSCLMLLSLSLARSVSFCLTFVVFVFHSLSLSFLSLYSFSRVFLLLSPSLSTSHPLPHHHLYYVGIPSLRSRVLAEGKWNKQLFASVCTDLVPDHMMNLRDELNGHDAGSLYRFWPSAKRTKKPFLIMLPGQVSRRRRRNTAFGVSVGCTKETRRLFRREKKQATPIDSFIVKR